MAYLLLLFTTLHCVSVFAISIENTCFKHNTNFISRYFSTQPQTYELENFFKCIDNSIQLFLNHTPYHYKKGYYTQRELRHFIMYMGIDKSLADKMSTAILNLKTGFIGGNTKYITVKEIAVCRKILYILKQRMRAVSSVMPVLIQIMNKRNIPKLQVITAAETMRVNLISLGSYLSKISFTSDLSLLNQLPQNLSTLGITNKHLKYWQSSLSLLRKWKNIFFTSSEYIVQSSDWSPLLQSFGHLLNLWFYYKRFMENQSLLNTDTIQHTQYFASYALNLIKEAMSQSRKKHISLHDIDELAKQLWFIPGLSKPAFRLGLRSAVCFVLDPLTYSRPCRHNIDSQEPNLKISFSDLTFTITNTKQIYESRSGSTSDRIQQSHLAILQKYTNSWIISESRMRKVSQLPPLFGSPHTWLKRKINITSDNRLAFYVNRTDNIPLLSHLNWQSWLMTLFTSAYTKRENKQVDQKLWNTMIKEWTPLSAALYKDMQWQRFQKIGFQFFQHGDLLTSQSNGDKILQTEEILEIFSVFTSSLSTVISSLKIMSDCRKSTYHLRATCVWNHLQRLPSSIFISWPRLLESLSQDNNRKENYIAKLSSFYDTKETELSIKDLFDIFLLIHYQENTMEYLDKDASQYLGVRELEPILDIFEQQLIETSFNLIDNKRAAFAFITYMVHYNETPLFRKNKKISAPLHFSNWLLNPKAWEQIRADRENILHTLFLMNLMNNEQ